MSMYFIGIDIPSTNMIAASISAADQKVVSKVTIKKQ